MRRRMSKIIAMILAGGLLVTSVGDGLSVSATDKNATADATELIIDGSTANTDAQTAFKGIGTVSCNNSSRLLMDYKEENPSAYWEIMNWLFNPDTGAGLSHVKVELGCDTDTSSGAEPATKRSADETANVSRGAGFMFAHDAKSINPDVTVDMLCWGMPEWVDEAYDKSDAAGYKARYKWYKETIDAAYDTWGIKFDYVSANQNEKSLEVAWTIYLSNALKSESVKRYDYSKIKIVAADETDTMYVADKMLANKNYRNAVDVIGCHYNSYMNANVLKLNKQYGKEIWYSEGTSVATDSVFGANNTTDGVSTSGTNGMLDVANRLIIGFGQSNMTNYEFQPSVASYYDGAVYYPKQLIAANEPWSGHYDIGNGLVMTMHFTNFVKKGWQYITSGSYGDGTQENHSISNTTNDYLTAADPDTGDYSTVITNDSSTARTYSVKVSNISKASSDVNIWETRSAADGEEYDAGWMNHIDTLTPVESDGVYTYKVTVKPYSMITLTTTTGQETYADRKAQTVSDDASVESELDMPYSDDFEYSDEYIERRGGTPRYTCDLNGAFEVEELSDGNKVLKQQINKDIVPIGWGGTAYAPTTSLGDDTWRDYEVSVDAMLDPAESGTNYVALCARYNTNANANGYWLRVYRDGTWRLISNQGKIASGTVKGIKEGRWFNMRVKVSGNTVTAYVNNVEVACKTVSKSPVDAGRVALGSSYNENCFDNLIVQAVDGGNDNITRIDDMDSSITFSDGALRQQSLSYTNYGRTLSSLTKKGQTMTYTFTGTGVSLIGCNYAGPKFKVTLDGQIIRKSSYVSDTESRCAFYSCTGLDNGEHTIVVELTNSEQLDLDAIEVMGSKTSVSVDDITNISFGATKSAISYGESLDLQTEINGDNSIKYSTSNMSVAMVTQDGILHGNGAGSARITATASNGVKASYDINVTQLAITPGSGIRVGAGEKVSLSAAYVKNINKSEITGWSSSDTSIATVNANGKVTTKKVGNVVITATGANGYTGNVTIHVKKAPYKIILWYKKTTLKVGKKEKIECELPKGTVSTSITFKSSKKSVATVSKKGVVKAKKKGKCTITISTYNGKKAKYSVTVK